MHDLLRAGVDLKGAVSAEHGIGRAKKKYFAELEDPTKLALMRGIKKVFDPNGILNPGVLFD
jgi:glycolate oxidase